MHTLLGAALLLAGAKVFQTPLPIPDLIGAPQSDAAVVLGKEDLVIDGEKAQKICAGKCDTLLVYGPTSAPGPTVTTASTFVYVTKGKIVSIKWAYPGDLQKPDGYPQLRKLFGDLHLPLDAEVASASDPITVERVTDTMHRTITWSEHGVRWTAIVTSPLVRGFEPRTGQQTGLRPSIMEEYRVVLVEAGPERNPGKPIRCTPDSVEPFFVFDGVLEPPVVKKHPDIVFPTAADMGGMEGTVVMEFVVGTNGLVESVTPVRGHPAFNENAVDGIKRWKYQPYLCQGKPIRWKSRAAILFGQR